MTNRWIGTPLGQSIIAIIFIILYILICLYTSTDFLTAAIFIFLLPAGFRNPYIFMSIFFTLSVFRIHEVIPVFYSLNIPFISALLGIFSLGVNIHLGRIKLYWRREMSYFVAFFILVTLGVPLAYMPSLSFHYWHEVFAKIFIIFFMITWTMTKENAYKLIVYLIVLSGVYLSFITLNNLFQGTALVEQSRASVGSIFKSLIGDPNDLALTLLFSFSFSFSILICSSHSFWLRISGILSSGIIMAAIIATQSRGGLLGLAAVLGYFVTHRIKSKLITFSFIILIIIFLYLMISGGFSRFSGSTEQGLGASSMGRIYAWKAAINMALHHPFFGVGLDAYKNSYFNYAVVWEKRDYVAHSAWFQVLSETGFPGFLLFICCVYGAVKTAFKNIYRIEHDPNQAYAKKPFYLIVARGLFAGLISFCLTGTFLSQGFSWPFYIFFALTISLAHNLDKGMGVTARNT